MSYLTQGQIADNRAMQTRVAQCAVGEGLMGDADRWTYEQRRTWASAPGWDAAWESALAASIEDPGADEAVITDAQILSQVQTMIPPPPA